LENERLQKLHEDWFNGPEGVRWYMQENMQLRAALQSIRDGRIIQGMSASLFAEKLLQGTAPEPSKPLYRKWPGEPPHCMSCSCGMTDEQKRTVPEADYLRVHRELMELKYPGVNTRPACPHGATSEEVCPECLGAPSDNPDDGLGTGHAGKSAPEPNLPHTDSVTRSSDVALQELIRTSTEWREREGALTDRPYYLLGDWLRWAGWRASSDQPSLTDWEKARDVVQEVVCQTSGDMRIGALHCLHAVADAMRGTPASPSKSGGGQ